MMSRDQRVLLVVQKVKPKGEMARVNITDSLKRKDNKDYESDTNEYYVNILEIED